MPSTVSWRKIFCLLAACSALFGCSAANDQAPVLGSDSKHPDGWRTAHRSAYQQNRDQCFECHGTDLKGGITKVDCFNQAALGQCHANGHGPRNVPHALPFTAGSAHGPAAKNDLVYCQSCHGTSGGPGGNPRFNVPLGALLNGCEDCHKPLTAHPPLLGSTSGWSGHSSAGSMGSNCTLCHGVDLTGAGGVGPGCNSCHSGLSAGAIPTVGACTSCHAKPPATGNHTVHNALAAVAGVCSTCHDKAGIDDAAKHNNGTKDVAFAVAYNAKNVVATRNVDGSCSNVSCHGGIPAPAWGGTLTAGCLSCHTKGTALNNPQYNSYYSGRHTEHLVDFGLQCADCHDMTLTVGGASHFGGLGTIGFELAPSATIKVPGYTKATPSCSPGAVPAAGTYSVGICHSNKVW